MTYLPKALRYERDAMVAAIMAIAPAWSPKFVVLHNTASPSLAQWKAYSPAQKESWGDNLNAYYRRMGWHSGPHLAATPEPWSYVLCDLNNDGVHASCFNHVAYGLEMVGDFRPGGDAFDPAVRDSAVNILAALHVRFGWDPDSYIYGVRGLHFHCECKADNHACPGAEVSKSDMITRILNRMAEIKGTKMTDAQPLPTSTLAAAETPMPPTIELTPWPALADDPAFFALGARVFNQWKINGVSNPFALGMLAQAEAECSLNVKAIGDKGTAFGLHQWHNDRCAAIAAGCGVDPRKDPPVEAQVNAAWWELAHVETAALAKIRAAETAKDAGIAAAVYYERAGAPMAAERRGAMAERWADLFQAHPELLTANHAS